MTVGLELMHNAYSDLDGTAFWRTGVVDASPLAMAEIYKKRWTLEPDWKIATAGSCFAQHIAGYLMRNGYNILNVEPAPSALPEELRRRYGYSLYSGRYGNIYTSRQLLQLFQEVFGEASVAPIIWQRDGRFFDAYRPAVEPEGLPSADEVTQSRAYHLERLGVLFREMDVFVFTMGMTETWQDVETGQVVPIAPGVIAGEEHVARVALKNLSCEEVVADFREIMRILDAQRTKELRYILTVSPVPITATGSGLHVLAASSYTKATLRSAAGTLYQHHQAVDYFPGYEIVTNPSARGVFFEPNLRSVSAEGVDLTMRIFFSQQRPRQPTGGSDATEQDLLFLDEPACEEVLLDAFGP
ncbi:MAG: GSCFA domain-containing protein [Pseudomonadota bacterium]